MDERGWIGFACPILHARHGNAAGKRQAVAAVSVLHRGYSSKCCGVSPTLAHIFAILRENDPEAAVSPDGFCLLRIAPL